MREYIVPIYDDSSDYEEIFFGYIRENAKEIIRCKDCQYGYQFYDVQNGITDSWVECRNPDGLNRDAPENGYCYCGERRSGETN